MIGTVAITELLELAWVSLIATILLSIAASTCVLGVTRASELRRAGHPGLATRYAALALAGALAIAGGGVIGAALALPGGAEPLISVAAGWRGKGIEAALQAELDRAAP